MSASPSVSFNHLRVSEVLDPLKPGDAATKSYVDSAILSATSHQQGSVHASADAGIVTGPVSPAQRILNAQALQSLMAYCAASGLRLVLPPGRYEYDAQAAQSGRNVGLQVPPGLRAMLGFGPKLTHLVQYAVNHPAITIGDVSASPATTEGCAYGGFAVGHGVEQTGQQQADGMLMGNIWGSRFDAIEVTPWLGSGRSDPYVGLRIGLSGQQFFFSNELGTIIVRGGQEHVLRSDANGTGNTWRNLYCGGGWWGDRLQLTSHAAYFGNFNLQFGTIDQFNIEWVQPGAGAYALATTQHVDIGTMNLEANKIVGYEPALIHAIGDAHVRISQLRALNNWLQAGAITGTPRFLSAYHSGRLSVEQMSIHYDGATYQAEAVASVAAMVFRDSHTALVGRAPECRIGHLTISGNDAAIELDAASSSAVWPGPAQVTAVGSYEFHVARPRTRRAKLRMLDADMLVHGMHRDALITLHVALTAVRDITLDERIVGASGVKRQPGDTVRVSRNSAGADLRVRDGAGLLLHTMPAGSSERTFEWSGSAWV